MQEKSDKLKEACIPLLKYLNSQECNPHMTVIVTATGIELVESVCSIQGIHEFMND
jgi:hypothetical protein